MDNFILDSQYQYLTDKSCILLIQIKGALTKSTSYQFDKFFQSVIEKNKTKRIVLGFSNLSCIDSTGLGLLASIQEKLQEHEIQLNLAEIPPKVEHLFEMLGMRSYFKIFKSKELAFQDYGINPTDIQYIEDALPKSKHSEEQLDKLGKKTSRHEDVNPARKTLFRTIKIIKEKDKKKKDPQKQTIVQIDYYKTIPAFASSTIQITVSYKDTVSKQEKLCEITHQIPSCVVVPSVVRLAKKDSQQATFSITPVGIFPVKGEIIIATENGTKRLPIGIQILNSPIPKINNVLWGIAAHLGIVGVVGFIIRRSVADLPNYALDALSICQSCFFVGVLLSLVSFGLLHLKNKTDIPQKAEPLVYICQ